jgi:hypothetical protein
MMRSVALLLTAILITAPAIAQLNPTDIPASPKTNPQPVAAPVTASGNTTLQEGDIPKDVKGGKPLDFEGGADAAVLKGKGVVFGTVNVTPEGNRIRIGPTGFTSFDVNAQYNYTDRSKRIAEIGVRPSLLTAWTGDPFGPQYVATRSIAPYLDLRSRSLDRPKTTNGGTTTTADNEKAFFYGGAGVEYRSTVTPLLRLNSLTGADVEAPSLGVTYYKKISGDLPKDAPEGFNALQARLTFDVPIPLTANLTLPDATIRAKREQCFAEAVRLNLRGDCPSAGAFPFTFSVDLKVSRPTEGSSRKTEHYADIAVKMMQENSKIGYAVRYRSGKDLGFEYDKEILASIVMRLFK